MHFITKLNQIKKLLSIEVELETITLVDGTTYSAEKVEVGYSLYNYENLAIAEGIYNTNDGKTIACDMNGVIISIEETPEVVEMEATNEEALSSEENSETPLVEEQLEEVVVEEEPVEEEVVEEHTEEMEDRFLALEARILALEEMLLSFPVAMSDIISNEVDTKLAKLPASTNTPKKTTQTVTVHSVDNRLEFLKSLRNK